MPTKKRPTYTLHKSSGQARVRIGGRDHYLGEYGSQESRDRYDDLIAEWLLKNGDTPRYTLTVDELVLLLMEHAATHYLHAIVVRDGCRRPVFLIRGWLAVVNEKTTGWAFNFKNEVETGGRVHTSAEQHHYFGVSAHRFGSANNLLARLVSESCG